MGSRNISVIMQQQLQIIKTVIDTAVKAGLFPNTEEVTKAHNAYYDIVDWLSPKPDLAPDPKTETN